MTKKHMLAAGICLLLAVALLTTGTFAWLSKEQKANGVYAVLSDFEVEGELSFGGKVYGSAALPAAKDGSILVPVSFVPGEPTYIGSMKYVVRYRGASPAYVRVRVLEQWMDIGTNEIMSTNYLNYYCSDVASLQKTTGEVTLPVAGTAGENNPLLEKGTWVDNRRVDYCYYYSVPVQPRRLPVATTPEGEGAAVTAVADGVVDLVLFDQASAPAGSTEAMIQGIDPKTTQLMLLIELEAVQPNRFRAFFGIDAIPQKKP